MSAADCWLAAGMAAAVSVNAVLGYWLYLTFLGAQKVLTHEPDVWPNVTLAGREEA